MRITPEELYRRIVMMESVVKSLQSQLRWNTSTGLINPTGLSTAYFVFDQPGVVVTDTSTRLYVPFACTLSNTWCTLVTASSSGSVTFRLTDGTTNWDHTFTSGSTTTQTLTPAASLSAGALLRATVTAAGTDAQDLALLVALTPTG